MTPLRIRGMSMRVLAGLVLLAFSAWGGMALWFQLPGIWRIGAVLIWLAVSATMLYLLVRGVTGWPWVAYAVLSVAMLVWWHTLAPSNSRLWADDVAQMLSGRQHGNRVHLDNVRNFQWRSDSDYTVRWESRDYDLDALRSVDMVLSSWGVPGIVHTLVSFGFADGRHLVFSVEIRKEKHESFSELGGFFKQFELSVVAADERDIIYVRTAVRGEQVSIYPVQMPLPEMRALFLAYVQQANALHDTPRFYHTVTANCTTLVYSLVQAIVPGLPLDYRLLLSAYLPEYLYANGGLDRSQPLATLRQQADITQRAAQAGDTPAFSQAIRSQP